MKFAIAAAGTGGHVYPALAVAEELVKRGHDRDDVVFFGGDRLEATAVPAAGFPFVAVEVRGLKRSISPSNLMLPVMVARAASKMAKTIRSRGVSAVLAMGGYVTGPAAIAARRTRSQLVIHEQNGLPGLANRLASRVASEVLVAFPSAAAKLRRATVVGNPLRAEFVGFDRAQLKPLALARYGLDAQRPVLGVLGGSLGAKVLNEVTAHIVAGSAGTDLAVVHLTGTMHVDSVTQAAHGAPVPWVVSPFEESMEFFYAASDLVLSRAGAITISELAATGTPAVTVPLEAVAQAANASFLAEAGAAEVVRQSDIDSLPQLIHHLIGDAHKLAAMSAAARSVATPDAAQRVAVALEEVAGRG
ncbi:MAG: undecaprenyldiphospho-muramoylpentapeptide beta-N-acetylglucosaminyltransferase [Acidimicrobiia bacterium]|nr:undecaprenyldiphospho-muramoylpentapeptide beta-N-acetylglucosaminyltransferase [Acidimicrobiia bacterium]